jgi:SHS2 domain-containing protein
MVNGKLNGESSDNVRFATIYKVIYNLETLNVIYVSFETIDSNVYDLNDVAYFNRFLIKQEEYVEHLN